MQTPSSCGDKRRTSCRFRRKLTATSLRFCQDHQMEEGGRLHTSSGSHYVTSSKRKKIWLLFLGRKLWVPACKRWQTLLRVFLEPNWSAWATTQTRGAQP